MGGYHLPMEVIYMPELNTKKHLSDEAHPVLSLKQDETKKEAHTEEEQEALWSRSLEFFNRMNVASSHS